MLKIIPHLFATLITTTACAQQLASEQKSTVTSKPDLNRFLFWKSKIDRQGCTGDAGAPDERLVRIVDLTADRKLLQFACDFGAYQDSYQNYIIDSAGNILETLSFMVPSEDNYKLLKSLNVVWGSMILNAENDLELLYLSAGSGACGYRATYKIDAVLLGDSTTPLAVHGDMDCYNGELVPSWPKISLID